MFDRDDRIKARDINNQEKREYANGKETLIAMQVDKIQRFYDGIESRLQALHDEKSELMQARVSKEDFRKYAKAGLQGAKEFAYKRFAEHLEISHSKGIKPFPAGGRLFPDHLVHHLAYLVLSEEDLDNLIDQLPEGSLTEKQRNIRLKAVDGEISSLKAELAKKIEAAKRGELVLE